MGWRQIYGDGAYPGGPMLKVVRAEKHLEEVEVQLTQFLGQRPYRATGAVHQDGDRRVLSYTAQVLRDVPTPTGPIIGDILHNLRSALDGALYGIVERTGAPARDLKNSEFPIYSDRREYLCPRRKYAGIRLLERVPLGARSVVHQSQPFRARDPEAHQLWLLQSLNNLDKHRYIHLGGAFIREVILTSTATRNAEVITTWTAPSGPFGAGSLLAAIVFQVTGPDSPVNVDEQFPFDIAFVNAGPATGLLVVPTLRRLLEYVTLVVTVLTPYAEIQPG